MKKLFGLNVVQKEFSIKKFYLLLHVHYLETIQMWAKVSIDTSNQRFCHKALAAMHD